MVNPEHQKEPQPVLEEKGAHVHICGFPVFVLPEQDWSHANHIGFGDWNEYQTVDE